MELELGPLRFGIVGAGRLGCVIGQALQAHGFELVHVSSATAEGRAAATRLLDVPAHEDPVAATLQVDCVLLCVPDDDRPAVVAALAKRPADASPLRLRIVSTSAVGGTRGLQALADLGHDVGVLHPMTSVVRREDGPAVLTGAGAAIGADDDATRTLLYALAHALDLHPFDLDAGAWALHAAACTIAANGATALVGAIEDLAADAGIHPDVARAAYGRLAVAALDRAAREGSVAALTGPVLRGDAAAVAEQVRAVRDSSSQVDALFIPIVASIANRAFTSGRLEMQAHREVLEAVLDPSQFTDGAFRYREDADAGPA
jgi:predicted short-subunit dehydrogenase-like oxidoreductase (DUF2520 family)